MYECEMCANFCRQILNWEFANDDNYVSEGTALYRFEGSTTAQEGHDALTEVWEQISHGDHDKPYVRAALQMLINMKAEMIRKGAA